MRACDKVIYTWVGVHVAGEQLSLYHGGSRNKRYSYRHRGDTGMTLTLDIYWHWQEMGKGSVIWHACMHKVQPLVDTVSCNFSQVFVCNWN